MWWLSGNLKNIYIDVLIGLYGVRMPLPRCVA